MFCVIAYDIRDDKRRAKLAKTLLDAGARVQCSVFECHLSPRQFEALRGRVTQCVINEEDSVRFYKLCDRYVERIEILGRTGKSAVPDVYIM